MHQDQLQENRAAEEPEQLSLFPELEQPEPQPNSAQNPDPETPKRNSGRTGATTPEGKMKTRLNSLRHSSCARTLILPHENSAKYFELNEAWVSAYPHDSRLLQDFILRTVQAEWQRIRIQDEYNSILQGTPRPEIYNLPQDVFQALELQQRYLTTAERKFQREFSMLERFWNNHCKPKKSEQPKPEPKPEPTSENSKDEYLEPWEEDPPAGVDPKMIRFQNSVTGEYFQDGQFHPPPPDWKPIKIVPGVFHPDDLANWRYEGDPKERFKPKKRPKRE